MAHTSNGKRIRVRIAVAMDSQGNWSAAGWNGASDKDAIRRAIRETMVWLSERGYSNVLVEIANECNNRLPARCGYLETEGPVR